MEFRLLYEGSLKGSGNKNPRVGEKHKIRRQFHKQLRTLWETHPSLQSLNRRGMPRTMTYIGLTSREFDRCGYQFMPLVTKKLDLICGLDILFLRRENPGDLVMKGGDVDNRIKTLLDALRIPENCSELDGSAPESDESPFFCLLENDSLVTELNITTDRLLKPLKPEQHENEVFLILKVRVKVTGLRGNNIILNI